MTNYWTLNGVTTLFTTDRHKQTVQHLRDGLSSRSSVNIHPVEKK